MKGIYARTAFRRAIGVHAVAFSIAALSGCADQMLSDDRIASATSGMLGIQPNQVTISDRRSDMNRTYYTATTSAGQQYTCLMAGGNVMTMGMTGAPICGKKGEGITLPSTSSKQGQVARPVLIAP